MNPQIVIGYDIGGTKSTVVIATVEGEIIGRITGATEISEGPLVTVNRLISDTRRLIEQHSVSEETLLGVGISCGGPLDRNEGIIIGPPNTPGWDYVPIVKLVEDALGLRAVLENDADSAALAELFFGVGKGKKNIVSFTWGTGIGAGVVVDGRLYTGTSGLAGEIGHITYITGGRVCQCGKSGCIEAYGSGSSISRIASEMVRSGRDSALKDADVIDARAVCNAARAGDRLAIEVLTEASHAMGRAIAITAHTLNPQVITLGTLAIKAGGLLMPEVLRVVEQEVWEEIRKELIVMPSPLGDRFQDLAAVSAFLGQYPNLNSTNP